MHLKHCKNLKYNINIFVTAYIVMKQYITIYSRISLDSNNMIVYYVVHLYKYKVINFLKLFIYHIIKIICEDQYNKMCIIIISYHRCYYSLSLNWSINYLRSVIDIWYILIYIGIWAFYMIWNMWKSKFFTINSNLNNLTKIPAISTIHLPQGFFLIYLGQFC